VTTGLAAVLLLVSLAPGRAAADPQARCVRQGFRRILTIVLIGQVGIVLVWWAGLYYGSVDAQAAAAAVNANLGHVFWIAGVGLGLAAPLLVQVLGAAALRGGSGGAERALTVLTALLVLAGAFALRYAIVIGGQLS
jgi:formate-dependent nitrite reductase membrane component NrfD